MDLLNIEEQEQLPEETFLLDNSLIGTGGYGRVFKVRRPCVQTGREYALKESKIPGKHKSIEREIAALYKLRHENIINLESIYIERTTNRVWILLELADYDLSFLIKRIRQTSVFNAGDDRSLIFNKSTILQILKGVAYMHENGIFHRDLKPGNILVTSEGRVKVADFGFAEEYRSPRQPFTVDTPVVATYWYRAPELILGEEYYTPAIDMWSVGCIFAELLTLRPVFECYAADTSTTDTYDPDLLEVIFNVLGKPDDWIRDLPHGTRCLSDFDFNHFKHCNLKSHLNRNFYTAQDVELNFLQKMLLMNPDERVTSHRALDDPYFKAGPLAAENIFVKYDRPFPKRKFKSVEKQNYIVSLTQVELEKYQQWEPSNSEYDYLISLQDNQQDEMTPLSEVRMDSNTVTAPHCDGSILPELQSVELVEPRHSRCMQIRDPPYIIKSMEERKARMQSASKDLEPNATDE